MTDTSSQPNTAQTAAHSRPLSPHISIYNWHISMILSILHRATGVALMVGIIALVAWFWSVAYCPEAVSTFESIGSAWYGRLLLVGWTFAFFLHFGNGIRHLFWDGGKGFQLDTAWRSGVIVAGWSVLSTALLWFILLA